MKRLICVLGLFAMLSACEKKADEVPVETNNAAAATAPSEKVVTTEIPSELQAEAEQEVTAENVDEVAAELEKEIEADTP